MSLPPLLSLLVAWLLGTLLVSALVGEAERRPSDTALRLALGALLGLGVTAVIFCGFSLLVDRPGLASGIVEAALLAVLARRLAGRGAAVVAPAAAWTWPQRLLASCCAQALLVAAVVAWRAWAAAPWGGWDGWAIWNLHARLLARGGTDWPALLAAPQLSWTHPDYPRLVAAGVARAWAWTGAESPAAAGLVSAAFAAALLGVLVAGLHVLRGRIAAAVGGLLLVGTPFFVTFATNEHADIPFAAYALAAVVCGVRGWLIPAALFAGLAAWTKNEGLLFAAVFGAVLLTTQPRQKIGAILGALALGLLPVIGFKLGWAPANDLMGPTLAPRLAQLFDPARHGAILSALGRDLRQFGEWTVLPYFALALGWWASRRAQPVPRLVPLVIVLMAAGYYVVYLLSPHDLAWHLDTSLVRLLLQLWPLVIVAWCLRWPEAAATTAGAPSRVRRLGWWGANLGVAAGLLVALGGQLGAGEVALRRVGLGKVTLAWGEGWYSPESLGRQRWAWSRGEAQLRFAVDPSAAGGPQHVRFTLRSLGARRVAVTLGNRVVWSGAVAEVPVTVELKDLVLPEGETALVIASDQPPRAESAAPGARALAFAVYDPELR
jgi:hypothetical protein